jgi:hypothetical protein
MSTTELPEALQEPESSTFKSDVQEVLENIEYQAVDSRASLTALGT